MKARRVILLLLLGLAARPPAVRAGAEAVPEYSTVDSALVVCPAGDLPFVAIARIQPEVLAFRTFTIMVDVTDCAGLVLGTIPQGAGLARVQYGGRTYLEQICGPPGTPSSAFRGAGSAPGSPSR